MPAPHASSLPGPVAAAAAAAADPENAPAATATVSALAAAANTATRNTEEVALDQAAFGSRDTKAGPNANHGNGSAPAVTGQTAGGASGVFLSVEQRRWLLLRAIELMDRREQSALQQWRHYRCPGPGTLLAPARGDNGERPLYRLDLRRQRCSCPDQAFCDAFNAKCEAAGLPAWARLCCKHHRIAQLLSVWRHEFGAGTAPTPSCCSPEPPSKAAKAPS